MLNLLVIFFLREKRSIFINKYTFPLRLVASLINILFYYFIAKAFRPNSTFFIDKGNWNLFQFVMIGELSLSVLLDSLIIYPQKLRQIIMEGAFDSLLLTRAGILKPLLHMGLTSLIMGMTTTLFNILVLLFFFKFPVNTIGLIKTTVLSLSFIPFFTGLGIMGSASLIFLRRGSNFLGTLAGGLAIISGAYFPTSVFPQVIIELNRYLNPLQFLLIENRELLSSGKSSGPFLLQVFTIILAGIASLILSRYLFNSSLTNYKKRGGVIILGAS